MTQAIMMRSDVNPSISCDYGTICMANSGPNTNGSQFFVSLAPCPWLDGKHAVFGAVSEGLDVVETIGTTPTASGDRPLEEVAMETVTISGE